LRREARERRATKIWVLADEVFVSCAGIQVAVGEVAPPTTRNTNFFCHFGAVVQHQNFKSQLTRHTSAKKTSSASAYNCNIKFSGSINY